MVDNYIGTHWKFHLRGNIYQVIWQEETPAGIPGVPGNTILVLVISHLDQGPYPSQPCITIPVAMIKDSGHFTQYRNPTADHPDQEPESTGHFEANT